MHIATIGVEDWLNVWEKSATYDIAQSTISSMTMGEILALDDEQGATFYERLNKEKMNYGWIEGSPAFKEEVAKLYRSADPDNVLQTNGATGANLLALLALVEPGDHVIAEYPTYQPLYEIPRTLGADVEYWHIRREHGWNPDVTELEKLVRPDTKLICINNASNPLGTVLDAATLKRIAEIAESVGAYVLSDEVYLPLHDTESYVSMADLYDRAIVTNSLSKTYSVPGARIGWTVSNKELADRFRVYRDYTMICDGVFNDALAVHVLRNRDKVLERNRAIVTGNLAVLERWLKGQPKLSFVKPRAGTTAFLKMEFDMPSADFCRGLLAEKGVLLVPGSVMDREGYLRIGYANTPEVIAAGLDKMGEYLAELPL